MCIYDRGLDEVRDEQETIRDYVEDLKEIDATLDPNQGSCARRKEKFETLASRFQGKKDPIHKHFAQIMLSFLAGLFAGGAKFAKIRQPFAVRVNGAAGCPSRKTYRSLFPRLACYVRYRSSIDSY